MPVIDKNYRLFGVVNLIDLVVVIALVIGGYAVYKVLGHRGATAASPDTKTVEYTLFLPTVRNWDPSQIRVGDSVATKADGKPIGTIVSVESTPSPIETYDTILHRYAIVSSTIFRDVYVKVKAQGVPSGTGVAVGNTSVRNGETLQIITPTFDWQTAVVTRIVVPGQ